MVTTVTLVGGGQAILEEAPRYEEDGKACSGWKRGAMCSSPGTP